MVFYHNIDPVLLNIGAVEIRYYGLIYVIGFIISFFIISYLAKKKHLKLSKDNVLDLIVYIALGVLIGGRIFYFVFYSISDLFTLEIFKIWHGGMSYHGGLIGVFIATYLYSKHKKIKFYDLADIIVLPAALCIALGRIGNFINGELIGRPTTLPWAFNFGDGIARHPSQLYQSLANFINFAVIWIVKDLKQPKGFLFWLYITLYGVFRFFTEFVRMPDTQLGFVIGNLTMGQLLSIPMIIVGLIMLFFIKKK